MTYTQEQKELLLDKLFDGVVCMDIYYDIDIIHRSYGLSYYNPKTNEFVLSYNYIWKFFENENRDNYYEIEELISSILRDTTERKELITNYWRG